MKHLVLAAPAVLLAVLTVLTVPTAPHLQENAATYRGREIAPVMSWRGADWLERATRVAEEDPAALLRELAIEPGATVVDFGCGSGYYARRLARLVGAAGRVSCSDLQPEMLRIAEQLAAQEGLTNVSFSLAAADDPKLPPASADLILLVDVYHELAHPAAVLAGLRRALRPNGRVALVEFRLEGESAAHILPEHRMSVEQVLAEWLPAGFVLDRQVDTLPTQHLFFFRPDPAEPSSAPDRRRG